MGIMKYILEGCTLLTGRDVRGGLKASGVCLRLFVLSALLKSGSILYPLPRWIPDVSAADGLFLRLHGLQRSPYGACVVVAGQHHTRCVRCRCTHQESSPPHHWYCDEDDGRSRADAWRRRAGGRLYGWLGSSPNLLCSWRHHRTILALLSSIF